MSGAWNGPEPCRGCGGPKPKGRGVVLCDDCRATRRKKWKQGTWAPSPCRECGDPKPKGPGRQLCDDCRELVEWKRERKAAAKAAVTRQPCKDCGKPKGPGKRLLCDACREAREYRTCLRCHQPKIRRGPTQEKLCDDCKPLRDADVRAYQRERKRLYRQDPAKAARMKEANRRWREKVGSTPAGRQQLNEVSRMDYRIRQLRNGKTLHAVADAPKAVNVQSRTVLPGRPLAAAIHRLAASMDPVEGTSADDGYSAVVERAGKDPRAVSAWGTGERNVGLDIADEVLINLDLCWWEVWNEDTLRRPVVEARSYVFPLRARHNGGKKPTRTLQRTRLYGDLGPDLDELRRVERLMTGQQLEAAA